MKDYNSEKIEGGYFIVARRTFSSVVMEFPLAWRFLWIWMIGKANHSEVRKNGQIFKRGTLLTSYGEMIEVGNYSVGYRAEKSLKKNDIESFVKRLKKEGMITTAKTTRGFFIRIVNYDYFQTPSNYEAYTETDKKTTTKPQTSDTINKNDENEKNEKNIDTGKSPESKTGMEKLREQRNKLAQSKRM